MTTPRESARERLEAIFRAALDGADPAAAVARHVALDSGSVTLAGRAVAGPVYAIAIGKAAAAMASAFERRLGARLAAGLAVVPAGTQPSLGRFAVETGSHPLPDASSSRAGAAVLAFAAGVPADATLVVLLSGGASSLVSRPAGDLTVADLAETTALLLHSGAPIDELNAVRKHLGAVGGGLLAQVCPAARMFLLAISDVPGDGFDVIGSGPLAPDPTRYDDALAVLSDRLSRADIPPGVWAHLEAGARGAHCETPAPADPLFDRVHPVLVASNATARAAALAAARTRGRRAVDLGERLTGEARTMGRRLVALGRSESAPVTVVAGGETTVRVRGRGRGGRSQELAMAAAITLDGCRDLALLAAGTDGIDGPTDAAGAFADGQTVARGRELGLDARASLADNDAYTFFAAEGGLLRTGATGTNVMDLALLEVVPR